MTTKDLTKEEKIEYMTIILQDILEKYKGQTVPNKSISLAKEFEAVGINKNTLIPTMALKYIKDMGLVDESYTSRGLVLSFDDFDTIDYRKMSEEILDTITAKRKEYDYKKKVSKKKVKVVQKKQWLDKEVKKIIIENDYQNEANDNPHSIQRKPFILRSTQEKFFIGELCFLMHDGSIREGRISRIEADGKNFEFIRYGIKFSSDSDAVNVDTNVYHTLDDLAKSLVKDIVKYK